EEGNRSKLRATRRRSEHVADPVVFRFGIQGVVERESDGAVVDLVEVQAIGNRAASRQRADRVARAGQVENAVVFDISGVGEGAGIAGNEIRAADVVDV